ncbi:hypothetical protein FQA39_LY15610 [Lamprigera yunnana]|nr:hypothetical protein FQA39_LY15610 [Lamprigera yunnana]
MMKICILLLLSVTWRCCVAPPVSKNEPAPPDLDLIMHYHRYLKEVVGALESDPEFKKKLETADENEIKSGKIANELEFVSHHVRNQLDELKRQELVRLRTLNKQQHHISENDVFSDPNHGHIDHANPHTFEVNDLKKLITETMDKLAEHDNKRREQFKEYEMQKEFEKIDKLNHTNGDERLNLEKEFKEKEEKHKKHEPLHEPGHKAQLEEVWQEQDHMQQEFDPKTFFMMHDLDGNGLWDQEEVKALFVKELNKMYDNNAPEDDMVERAEEMERMRETVFAQIDANRDGFIEYNEFLAQTKRQEYQEDHGWKGLDEQKPYTNEELEAYIREQQMLHPPPPGGYYPPPPGYNPNMPPQHGYNPNIQPPHPNSYPNQPNPPYYPPPQGQQYPNQGNVNANQFNQPPVHAQAPPVASQQNAQQPQVAQQQMAQHFQGQGQFQQPQPTIHQNPQAQVNHQQQQPVVPSPQVHKKTNI